MTSVSEIPLVRVHSPPELGDADDPSEPTFSRWKGFELPQPRRPSPVPLVVLAVLAGIGAMALGAFAVVSATTSADAAPPPVAKPIAATPIGAEQRVLALLAKPSTDRVLFRGAGGRLVLVVGSAGRAAVLLRGFDRAPASRPHVAWVVHDGRTMRAARFTGAERVVFLSEPVRRGDSVVVASRHPALLRPTSARVVAER
jgi:hypothetical protein